MAQLRAKAIEQLGYRTSGRGVHQRRERHKQNVPGSENSSRVQQGLANCLRDTGREGTQAAKVQVLALGDLCRFPTCTLHAWAGRVVHAGSQETWSSASAQQSSPSRSYIFKYHCPLHSMNTWVGDPQSHSRPIEETLGTNTGGFIITKTDLGVPYSNYGIMGPKTLQTL